MCIRDRLNKYAKIGLRNFEILPEFLSEKDFELFDSIKLREELRLPKDKKIILSFGGIDILKGSLDYINSIYTVSYTHLRAHETVLDLVCRLLLEKKKSNIK